MVKVSSRRSSAAGIARVSSPVDSPDEASTAKEGQKAKEGASSSSQQGHSSSEAAKQSDANGSNMGASSSQPMTASNSTSSVHSTKESATNGAGATAVPYGTRSRNRTGASRPNYAEDKELDIEFEATPATKESNGRKSLKAADPIVSDSARASTNAKKIPAPEPEQTLTVQTHHKEPIPGTSTFSANPAVAAPKKRKANNSSAQQSQIQMIPHNVPPTQAMTRGATMAAQVVGNSPDSNMLSFEDCKGRLKDNKLIADDGTVLAVNDHAYLVCEPPGEPYYLGRIMEFLHVNNDPKQPIDALRLNWYYRPKDIGRKVNDTRQVFASMHSDISPLTALRGKCQIKHKSEVEKLDDLRKTKDCFWYEKLYDRYIHRFYDVIPTSMVINVPAEVKKVLDERWKFIVVEPGRGKELTSAVKSCKRCSKYCASNDSVDCAVCRNTYHMSCVSPPLLKKPSRGFAWACGPCSKAQEKRLEARNTPNITDSPENDDEIVDEEEELQGNSGAALDTGRTSPEISSENEISIHPGTAEQIHQASLWLFRYLGIHCKVEDALDYDDRIYPRASSRLGPRHQAVVLPWPGRPVEYVKAVETKRKYVKGGAKKDAKATKDALAAAEAEKIARENRPKWVMDAPPGYTHRGEDYENGDPNATSQLLYKLPENSEIPEKHLDGKEEFTEAEREQMIFDFVGRSVQLIRPFGFPPMSTNVVDVALTLLRQKGYDMEAAQEALLDAAQNNRKLFKEPEPNATELKKFEDGVAKYGSEWHSIKKHVKTMSPGDIVRFYYTWKKSPRGKQVWGNYSGRKGKKEAKKAEATVGKLQDDVADEMDDSAFDNDKAFIKNRKFMCKFCATKESRQWRRAPQTPAGTMVSEIPGGKTTGKDKSNMRMVALCRRCAELWRRYAIQWEDIDEATKKIAQAGRTWKRKIDEETLKEMVAANEVTNLPLVVTPVPNGSANGTPAPMAIPPPPQEPPRKKLKTLAERESVEIVDPAAAAVPVPKKKQLLPEKPPPPPPPPEPPKPKVMPCAICDELDPLGDQHLSCKECRMTVHRNCYGVVSKNQSTSKWVCDMCSNDKNPQVSVHYKCILCPVEHTEHDFVEAPKLTTHKKKSEKDKERERVERENSQKVADYFRKKQEEMNKPVNPREPLKRTANNNWIHVTCAVFTPEVKFGNAKALEPSEGIPSIPIARYEEVCKICKNKKGACVSCHTCKSPVHVSCAHQNGYVLGFDITPVKGSRKDQVNTITIGEESGTMTAAVWCKEHAPTKTIVHRMQDIVDNTGMNALQLYVQNFKQADLALTGTVRKATLVNQSTKAANPAIVTGPPNRRTSTTNVSNAANGRASLSNTKVEEGFSSSLAKLKVEKKCVTCEVDVSPKWWPYPPKTSDSPLIQKVEGSNGVNGDTARSSEQPLPNGNSMQNGTEENGGTNVALAAAALHQKPAKKLQTPTEFQCHQCHFNKKLRKEPTPPPPPPVAPVAPIAPVAPVPPQESSRPPIAAPPANVNVPMPDAEIQPSMQSPYTSWPAPPVFLANRPPYQWPSPRHSPAPQAVPLVNHLNGNHSPHVNQAAPQSLNGQPPLRQQLHGIPHSPHQNGHNGHNGHMGQISNGYPPPPSPNRGMGSPALHIQSGTYASYASTRPPPQHLTNGGPPPRAPEHPFSQGAPMHSRSSFGQAQGSPPLHRDSYPQNRDNGGSQNHRGPNDGRVNGGASASPSLRNLLS